MHRQTKSLCLAIALCATPSFSWHQPAAAAEFMFRAKVNDQWLEGQPLRWDANDMLLLGRDGQLINFDPRQAKEGTKTGSKFVGYTMPEMKRELYREFGDSLEVTTTQHYIVVHPRDSKNNWAERFEELYRSCLQYFRVRGFTPTEPEFPLVAVVYRNQAEYFRAAAAQGTKLSPNTLGHYDLYTNRVMLYDETSGNDHRDLSDNADTIIHEATHQTAFNAGIHSRLNTTPQWLVEGLATMFEARGVWNAQSFHSIKDRVNASRLHDFRDRVAHGRPPGTLGLLVSSDQLFRVDPAGAYAEAWALSFYLCETRPKQYVAYLLKTASRAPFTSYPDAERMADFQEAFGSDLKQLEANFLAWMADIK